MTLEEDPEELAEERQFEAASAEALARSDVSRFTPKAFRDALAQTQSVPSVAPGRLRPFVPPYNPLTNSWEHEDVLARALNLLLLTPEVIVDAPALWLGFENFWHLRAEFPSLNLDGDGETAAVLRALAGIWDLVEDGSLLLGELDIIPGWRHTERAEGLSRDFTEDEMSHWDYQLMALEYLPHETTPWFTTDKQSRAAETLFRLVGSNGPDRRVLQVPKLAALDLPALRLHVRDLVAVRRSSDTFGEWRQQLGAALFQVELLPDSDNWQREASAIIVDELTPYAEKVRKETVKSTALSASVVGMKQMAIAGIGSAVGGLVGGSAAALAGLGGAGLATAADGLSGWVKARREAAPKRAVLRLVMVFDDRGQ